MVGHDHHGHSHGPGHAPADFGRAFLTGTILNLGFVAFEAGYGLAAGSMALPFRGEAGRGVVGVSSPAAST
jgi:Co/Zn/Cd efflux system component